MPDPRRDHPLREPARGVGFAIATGAAVLLAGLLVIGVFVWAMT